MTTSMQSNASDSVILVNGQPSATFGTGGMATNPQTIAVTMAANAATISALNSVPLTFRSATATSGATSIVTTPSANLVIPDTATLGSVNAIEATYLVVEMNYNGAREFAVSNISGGLQCDERNLISTTAISATADLANVWYSTTARTNLPYKLVGTFTCTQATAGTWATSASAVQSAFGNALTAMGSLGYGQTWQNLTGSRALSTTYYNTTGKPIQLSISLTSAVYIVPTIGGVSLGNMAWLTEAVVQPGQSYSVTSAGAISTWSELR